MTHLAFYRSSVGAGLLNVSLTFQPFSTDTQQGTKYMPPRPLKILAIIGWGVNMSDMQATTPFLLDTAGVTGVPISITAALASNFNLADYTDRPVDVKAFEGIDLMASSADAGAQTYNGAILLWDGVSDMPTTGRRFRSRFTSSTALTAGAWSRVALTPASTLPNKRFAIVGFYPRSATGLVARLDCPMSHNPTWNSRPGVPVMPNISSRLPIPFQSGYGGILGVFDNQTVPGMEMYATAADATQACDLDLIIIN